MTNDNPPSIFFRLLKTPIDEKGDALAAQIAGLNNSLLPPQSDALSMSKGWGGLRGGEGERADTFTLNPTDFSLIPGSPFAYWVGDTVRQLFIELPSVAESGISVQHGASSKNDFRFLRLWWEVPPDTIGQGLRWVPFAKGGEYSPYHADIHLLINWENDAQEIHEYLVERYLYLKGNTSWILHPENTYFRPGLTWPRRTTSGISIRVLPAGCIFADKGPAAFVQDDNPDDLMALLAVMNSAPFEALIKLQLGAATAAARSYEVGIIQRTPIPPLTDRATCHTLATLAREAHDLQRDRTDETTHAFCLPALVYSLLFVRDRQTRGEPGRTIPSLPGEHGAPIEDLAILSEQGKRAGSLPEAGLALEAEEQARQQRLAAIQTEIDDLVFDLYGLTIDDLRFSIDDSNVSPSPIVNLKSEIQNLLMWCVGVAFGRWDVRKALDPSLLPALPGPFDPLPRCAPGTLAIDDSRLTIDDWTDESSIVNRQSSILVDDPTHPADIVVRVREVLTLLWGDQAGDIEREACDILGFNSLRDYFRDPRRGFFAFHIKRYSKSRRKAPIYWLLQSEKRNYAIWLYYHRLTANTLFVAGRDYADAKVALEEARLEELRQGVETLGGSARRRRERAIERQQKLVAEVTDFRDRLDAIALRNLKPDLNDGVVLNIAPLWELAPWKEARRTWEKLAAGDYAWSNMAQQMRQRGLINRKS